MKCARCYHRVRARRAAAVSSAPHAPRVGTAVEGGGTGGTGGVGGGGGAQRSPASNMASTNRDNVMVLFNAASTVSSPMNCSHARTDPPTHMPHSQFLHATALAALLAHSPLFSAFRAH